MFLLGVGEGAGAEVGARMASLNFLTCSLLLSSHPILVAAMLNLFHYDYYQGQTYLDMFILLKQG
jgi:hypothetical protein